MPYILALQAVVLPGIFSLLTQLFCRRYQQFNYLQAPLMIIGWLMAYAWIVSGPNFPPRQASDWLGLAALFAVLPIAIANLPQKLAKTFVFVIVSAGMFIAAWPVLSFDATIKTHALIWLEMMLYITLLTTSVLKSPYSPQLTHPLFNFALSTATLGIITILSGSLLLGLLAIALAFAHAWPALIDLKNTVFTSTKNTKLPFNILAYAIAIFLLMMARFYAEIPFWAALLLIIGSGLTSLYGSAARKAAIVNALFCITALGITLYVEFGSANSQAAYY